MVVVVGALPARLFVCARGVCVEGTKFSSHMEPPPSPTPYPVLAGLLRCISQTPTEATARRKGSYGCTVPAPASGRVHHPWFACPPASLHPGMGTTRVHAAHAQGRGKGGLCAPRHACCPSIPPSLHHVAPLPSPPPYTARTCPSQILLLRPLQQGCSTARCRPSQCPESGGRTVQETPEARHSHCRGRRLHGPACHQRLWETTRAADAA